jgi:hypothetical protein
MTETAAPSMGHEVSLLVRSYYDIQKVRIEHQLRVKTLERSGQFSSEAKAEKHYSLGVDELQAVEDLLKKRIDQATKGHQVREEFMSKVSGIGPVLAGGIIAQIARREQVRARMRSGLEQWITAPELYPNEGILKERHEELGVEEILLERRGGIACFETISKLWAYAGLAVGGDGLAVRRKAGERSNWNAVFKTLAWKVGESFVKCGKSYREEYDRYKARIRLEHPEAIAVEGKKGKRFTEGNVHAMAKRYATKLFISHVWLCWRELEGLPVTAPYVIERLGHTTMKGWRDFLDR